MSAFLLGYVQRAHSSQTLRSSEAPAGIGKMAVASLRAVPCEKNSLTRELERERSALVMYNTLFDHCLP